MFVCQTLRLRPAIERDIAMERRRSELGFGPMLDLSVVRASVRKCSRVDQEDGCGAIIWP